MSISQIYYQINTLLESYINEGIKSEQLLSFLNKDEDNYKFIYNRIYRKLTLEEISFDSETLNKCLIDVIRDKIALFNDLKK